MKDNIPPLVEWSFDRMHRLYELCDRSFRACAREVGCAPKTFQKYYNIKKQEDNTIISTTIIESPRIITREKQPTKTTNSTIFLDPSKTKVAVLDIETSSLKSDFGIMICAVVKTYGSSKEPIVFKVDLSDPDIINSEKQTLQELNTVLEGYDGIITYFGSRFDVPFIRTRSLYHGIAPIGKKKSLDLYFTVKRVTNPSSRRLDRINQILQISEPSSSPDKTSLGIAEWNGVVFSRNPEMLEYVVDHCVKDVEILENAVNRFKEFLPERISRI